MAFPKAEDEATFTVINRAISIRPSLDFRAFQQSIKTAKLDAGPAQARLLMAHIEEFNSVELHSVCASMIASLDSWKDLCAELIRYSGGSIDAVNILILVLALRQPDHPVLQAFNGRAITVTIPAYDARDDGKKIIVRATGYAKSLEKMLGCLLSVENPVDWFAISKVKGVTLDQVSMNIDNSCPLRADNTIVIRPSIFFAAQ